MPRKLRGLSANAAQAPSPSQMDLFGMTVAGVDSDQESFRKMPMLVRASGGHRDVGPVAPVLPPPSEFTDPSAMVDVKSAAAGVVESEEEDSSSSRVVVRAFGARHRRRLPADSGSSPAMQRRSPPPPPPPPPPLSLPALGSNLSAPAEEERARFAKMNLSAPSKEERARFPVGVDSEEEEEGPDSLFAAAARCFRDTWNKLYSRYYGHFEDTTKIPNMRFTYKKPDRHESPVPSSTLQIFSLKVSKIRGGLQFPLHVFGKVAVRDAVDHNRNMIFHRPRESCQILTQEDPYLKLIGPTRAVSLVDPLTFEVDLQVKGITQDKDESLSFLAISHLNSSFTRSRLIERHYTSKLSILEFKLGTIVRSVEATISFRVRTGSWQDGFHARFSARTASIDKAEIILLDSGDDRVCVSRSGSIMLSRSVVSVESLGVLEVCVKVLQGEEIVVDKKKSFEAKKDGASHGILRLGSITLDVTIAWSLVTTMLLR